MGAFGCPTSFTITAARPTKLWKSATSWGISVIFTDSAMYKPRPTAVVAVKKNSK